MVEICSNHVEHTKKFDQQGLINSDFERRISSIETDVKVNKMESSKDIESINGKLDIILETLKTNQSRLPNLIWGVAGTVVGSSVVGVIMWFAQK